MIEPYRRHVHKCPHRSQGQGWTRCGCPIWGFGTLNGFDFRKSLQTRDWQRALRRIDALESGQARSRALPDLAEAIEFYIEDGAARNLRDSTLISYRTLLAHLQAAFPRLTVDEITVEDLTRFRAQRRVPARGENPERPVSSATSRKELEALRAFFRFAVAQGWRGDNPAAAVKAPRDTSVGALPFERHEIAALLSACDRIENHHRASAERARLRARALVFVLLYTGLRISDAAQLRRSQYDARSGYLTLRTTKKTGAPIRLQLADPAVHALDKLPREHSDYWLWSGDCDLKTIVNSLRRTVAMLGRLAGVHAHPHRFRDSFASELLTQGADIRTVSLLLGHTSVKTTEKHYSHFVSAHQLLLDAATARLRFEANEPARVLPMVVGKD